MGLCLPVEENEVTLKKEKKTHPTLILYDGDKAILDLPMNIEQPPIQRGDELIFLYTKPKKKTTKYRIFNLKTLKYSESIQIECDASFDIMNTVYTLNENDGKIWFIENNKDIKTLDLNTNKITSINKSIITTNDNYAQIVYVNKKLYILGAEDESDKDENYTLIPYSKKRPTIRKFGQYARVLKVRTDGADWIYIGGGLTQDRGADAPNAALVRFNLSGDDEKGQNHKFCDRKYLHSKVYAVGIINYKDEFIISFGGEVMEETMQKQNKVFVLPLKDKYELVPNYWYEFRKVLQTSNLFHVVYDGGDKIHLFSYDGKYYTISVDDIINEMKKGPDDGVIEMHSDYQQAGIILPDPLELPRFRRMKHKMHDETSSGEED